MYGISLNFINYLPRDSFNLLIPLGAALRYAWEA